MRTTTAAAIVVALSLGSMQCRDANRTLVGTWAPDTAACMPVAGMIEIGPKSLTADELACTFDDVKGGVELAWTFSAAPRNPLPDGGRAIQVALPPRPASLLKNGRTRLEPFLMLHHPCPAGRRDQASRLIGCAEKTC